MIKINWLEVQHLKTMLSRQGFPQDLEILIMILYHGKQDADRTKITLDKLEPLLFDIESDRNVRSIFLYDIECKRPFLRFREPERVNDLEVAPTSGHPSIVLEFAGMTPEAREVWLNITLAKLQQYLSAEI